MAHTTAVLRQGFDRYGQRVLPRETESPRGSSQDRITYEVYQDRTLHVGPEVDLYVDAGFNGPMIATGLEFALGAPAEQTLPGSGLGLGDVQRQGEHVHLGARRKRARGRPADRRHERVPRVVFAGYRRVEGWLELRVLDPAMGSYWFRPGELRELTGGDDQPAGRD